MSKHFVLTMYGSPQCGPCKAFKPVVKAVTTDARIEMAYIDVSKRPEVLEAVGITGVPTITLESDDAEIARHTGAMNYQSLRAWMVKYLLD